LAISPDGKRLISGGLGDKLAKVWDFPELTERMTIDFKEYKALGDVRDVHFTTDGALVAIYCDSTGIYFFSSADGKKNGEFATDSFASAFDLSGDAKLLAYYNTGNDKPRAINVVDRPTGAAVASFPLKERIGTYYFVKFLPALKLVAFAADNRVWFYPLEK